MYLSNIFGFKLILNLAIRHPISDLLLKIQTSITNIVCLTVCPEVLGAMTHDHIHPFHALSIPNPEQTGARTILTASKQMPC